MQIRPVGPKKIRKRSGEVVSFDQKKITIAIHKAGQATGEFDLVEAEALTDEVMQQIGKRLSQDLPTVEQVQDLVEETLLASPYRKTAKSYIIYRDQHARMREIANQSNVDAVDQYLKSNDWQVKENSNMTYSLQGLNNYIASKINSTYWLNKVYPREIREAHQSGDFHIHDLSSLSVYCVGWDLQDLLTVGFRGAPGKIESRPPKHFRAALGQICNFLYTLQGESAGAEAFSSFDTLLAPYIRYDGLTYAEVKQAMQEFVFNMNVPTRVGFQSLAWEEPIIIKRNGRIEFTEIGRLVDESFQEQQHRVLERHPESYAVENFDDCQALSFNDRGEAVWAGIKAFVRHRVPDKSPFVKIKTNRGETTVSPAHSLFAFQKFNGQFNPEPVSAQDLKVASNYNQLAEENHVLAMGKAEIGQKRAELDLVELIDALPQLQKNVFVEINPTRTLARVKDNILDEYQALHPFYIDYGIRDRGVWQDWLSNKSLRYDVWRQFGDQKKEVRFRLKNSELWYPRLLKGEMLRDFVDLCAWYVGEGHKGMSSPIHISQAGHHKQEIGELLERLNARGEIQKHPGYSAKGNQVQEVSKFTAKGLLAEIIGLTAGVLSFNKTIPWYVFELNDELRKIFLDTLIKGEGSDYPRHWDLTTTSRRLALGLSLLLSQEGRRFSVYSEKKTSDKWRAKQIIRIYKKNGQTRKKEYRSGDFEARVCLGREEVPYRREYEYDISVDSPQENFIGGTGGLVYHNTPFTNLTFDLTAPEHYRSQPALIGGAPQEETYGDFQDEMDMLNRAFLEVMTAGDDRGRVFTFPIPTYNITKDFDWNNSISPYLWEATAKYGLPYFANFVNSDMNPEDVRSMCCRLRLSLEDLTKRGGGLFGANPLTGSIGVVTINMPRLGYLSKNKEDFFQRLDKLMIMAKNSLEIKRKVLEKLTENDLYPYSKFYLRSVKERFGRYWHNHFSTIGLVGLNEAEVNFMGCNIASPKGQEFALEVLDFIRKRLLEFQEETGVNYNLEATPAEATSYRLALKDKERHPGIKCANEDDYQKGAAPYYTNSSQLPVDYTEDLFEILELQDEIQCKYTGGTVIHFFLGEKISEIAAVPTLVKKICQRYRLPYFTISPTFSVCPQHGYLSGEQPYCARCGTECEVYSRVVGYLRPTRNWNNGKVEEFKHRSKIKAG